MAINSTGFDRPAPSGVAMQKAMDPLTQFFAQLQSNPALYNAWRSADSEGAGGYNLAQQYLAPLLGQNFTSPEQVSAAVSNVIKGIDPAKFNKDANSAVEKWRQETLPGNPGQNNFFGMNPDTAAFLPLAGLLSMGALTAGGAAGLAGSGATPSIGGAGADAWLANASTVGAGDLALAATPQVTASSLGLTGAQAAGLGAAGGAASGALSAPAMTMPNAVSAADLTLAPMPQVTASSLGMPTGLLSTITGAASTAGKFLKDNPTLTQLGMAGLGAVAAGQDTTTSATSQKDPWKPAQPYLLDNLKKNAAMQAQYAQNPFNDAQKTAYQNSFNASDNFRNSVAPGLLNMVNSFQPYQRQATGVGMGAQRPQQQTGLLSANMQAPQSGNIGQIDWSKFLPRA